MNELDTITDFTSYLERKATFVRSGVLLGAAGEEELLAHYLTHMIDDKHDFVRPDNRPWKDTDRVAFEGGFYAGMLDNENYKRKKEADANSYLWDRLIEAFTHNMLEGTTIVPDGGRFELAEHEIAVRHMAEEPRVIRRMLGNAIFGVLEVAHQQSRTFRAIAPHPEKIGTGTGYVFMTLAHPRMELECEYEQYREARKNILYAYCMQIVSRCRYLKRVIGIATEPPAQADSKRIFSEDLIMVEPPNQWTPAFEKNVRTLAQTWDIMREGRIRTKSFTADEFPKSPIRELEQFGFASNAIGAVKIEGKTGRNDPCPCGSGLKYKKCCLKKA